MNGYLSGDPLHRRTEEFLSRVRQRSQLAMAAIGEAVAESARQIGRRHDPVVDVADAVLTSLRTIEREVQLAIEQVESLTKEGEDHGREPVIIIAGHRGGFGGQPVQPRSDPRSAGGTVPGD